MAAGVAGGGVAVSVEFSLSRGLTRGDGESGAVRSPKKKRKFRDSNPLNRSISKNTVYDLDNPKFKNDENYKYTAGK